MPTNGSRAALARRVVGTDRRLAASVVAAWVACELLLRRGGVPLLAGVVGSSRGADMLLIGVAFPVVALLLAAAGRRSGIGPEDWEYEPSKRALLAGAGGIVAYFLALFGFAIGYALLAGVPTSPATGGGAADRAAWVLVALLVANGVIVPISEELVWRGVVQTALVRTDGPLLGITVTAAAFVGKHLVVDMAAPTFRVASLVILAVTLGVIRHRYGTAGSTVTHLGVNLLATGLAVA